MNLAVDVYYEAERATVAGVWFSAWDACEPERESLTQVSSVAAYAPGQFYKRELPCLLSLLQRANSLPACIVVDGYVYLGREKKPGLGKYLYDALSGETAVIGVAKNRFKGTPRIVNVSSMVGLTGFPGMAPYAATRTAVIAFGDTLRRELMGTNVHVSTVLPGWTRTPMMAEMTQRLE